MKKILFITDMFPNRYNHVSGVFVKHQIDEISSQYLVKVISTSFPHKYNHEVDVYNAYKVEQIFYPVFRYFFLTAFFSYAIYAIPHIKRIIKEWKPDLIHVHDCRHVPELVIMKCILDKLSIPKYLSVHNIRTHPNMLSNNKNEWLYRILLKRAYTNWTHVFTVNDNLSNILAPFCNNAITNIGNAVGTVSDTNEACLKGFTDKLNKNAFQIISVGNLILTKGFSLLIESVSKLCTMGIEVQLTIVGSGMEESNLKSLTSSLNLNNNVFLLGSLNNDVVRNLYKSFNAFVLPSYSETFGIVYLEAMYAGIPVIGVKGQGIDGIVVDKVNGLLAEPRDTDDLTSNIQYLINNPTEGKLMAERGRKLVNEKYLLKGLINRIVNVYEE